MNDRNESTTTGEAVEAVLEHGLDGLAEAMTMLLNEAMIVERERYLGAAAYERTPRRNGYANGYKPKRQRTRIGELDLDVPQTRDGGFYPSALERGLRSERALTVALAEMYVQGVSTRKVAKIVEQMCGFEVSSSQVSRAAAQLDEMLDAWRNRPLGGYRYLQLDARYEKVRQGGQVLDGAVLWAAGVDEHGKRDILGVSVELSEAEVHWRTFLQSLTARGLHGVQLIASDDHAGLRAARKAVFTGVPWQRCQFHLQQNAQKYVPRQSLKRQVADDIRSVFNASDRTEAERLIEIIADRHEEKAPRLADWMRENLHQGLAVFALPPSHRRRMRTTNLMERTNQEIKRRTRVARVFPNEASCLRLVSAVLIEIAEDWQTGKVYINLKDDNETEH